MKNKYLEAAIRVDHAGEFGAVHIYKGQMAIIKNSQLTPILQDMLDQEKEHLAYFEEKLKSDKIRPTALLPLWRVLGFGLGAATALMGRRTAMACTVAVEEVIEEHYRDQLNKIEKTNPIVKKIKIFQADEAQHKNKAIEKAAQSAPFYPILRQFIRQSTKLAIFLSKKI